MSETSSAPAKFAFGDRVTWTDVKRARGGFNLSSREGVIVGLFPHSARVKMRNGRLKTVWFDELRHADQKTSLTEFFEGMASAAKEEVKP